MIKKVFPLWIFFLFIFFSAAMSGILRAENNSLDAVKNTLASVEERKAAIDELKQTGNPELVASLGEILRTGNEPIILRGYAAEALETMPIESAGETLRTVLNSQVSDIESRKLALHSLIAKEPVKMIPELIQIAQNKNEVPAIRVSAIQYLAKNPESATGQFYMAIFLNGLNPIPVRIAVLDALDKQDLFQQNPNLLTQTILASTEAPELRKSAVLVASRNLPSSDFSQILMEVIRRTDNSAEMRYFAINHLASQKPNALLLPQLKQILSKEKDPAISSNLKSLIENWSNPRL
jgi:hypothetical protein